MVDRILDHLDADREPASMLEQELSRETLNAIKAIVSDGSDQTSNDDTRAAISDCVASPVAVPVAKSVTEKAPVLKLQESDKVDFPADETLDDTVDDIKEPFIEETELHSQQDDAEQESKDLKVEDSLPVDVGLIRQTVAEMDHHIEPVEPKSSKANTIAAPEEVVISPPGLGLRLKRYLMLKLRMHALILKMKIRDRIPTKREALRAMTPRRLAIATIVLAILLEPWFLPTAFVLVLFFGSLTLLLMGPDRVRHYSEKIWKWYGRKNPEKATRLHRRMMALLERWQGKVDRLPSKWTQGIHLPQIQSDAEKSAAESAYAMRMARIAKD